MKKSGWSIIGLCAKVYCALHFEIYVRQITPGVSKITLYSKSCSGNVSQSIHFEFCIVFLVEKLMCCRTACAHVDFLARKVDLLKVRNCARSKVLLFSLGKLSVLVELWLAGWLAGLLASRR